MNIWGLIAVKRFGAAKSRLSGVLDDGARTGLARALFDHVFEVLSSSPHLAGVAVVTDCPEIAARAAAAGALAVRDTAGAESLADTVDAGIDQLSSAGADSVLVFMSDLPDLTESDVHTLCAELSRVDMVAVSDECGTHTNALGMRLATRSRTYFGDPNSFSRHCEAATKAGLALATPSIATVAFDIDTPSDLARFLARARGRDFSAGGVAPGAL